jgi:hypothetical protein
MHTLKATGCVVILAGLSACGPAAEPPATPPKAEAVAAAPAAPAPASKYKEVESPGAHKDHVVAYRTDTVDVPLAAAKDPQGEHEIEYMVRMKAGDTISYAWQAQGAGDFWHEFHGHTADTVTFYKKAAGATHQGSLTAPFDGIHGWYFENRTAAPVVVRVRISGFYELEPPKAKP